MKSGKDEDLSYRRWIYTCRCNTWKIRKRKVYCRYITRWGEGLYKALADIYDLIILDVMLPNLNGFEILKKLSEEKVKSKIIMLTARYTLSDKLEGLNGGANDYITKPFHIEELTAVILTTLLVF
mgnify:CR=1 FL=1